MGREVPLADIEVFVSHYKKHAGLQMDLSSFPWLQERLSFFSRFLGFLGATKTLMWQRKYLFPTIFEASMPHLRRFYEGNWKIYEETRLKNLFEFLGEHLEACKGVLSFDLLSFLRGSSPSFSNVRELMRATSREGMWKRDETYAEYKKRLKELSEKVVDKQVALSPSRAIPEEVYKPLPLSKQTKEQLDGFLEKLHASREKCMEYNFQLEKDCSKVFPLRFDFEPLISALHQQKENLLALTLEIENEIAKLSEIHVLADEERAKPLIQKSFSFFKKVESSLQRIEQNVQGYRTQIEEARSSLYQKLGMMTKSIDRVPLLPSESLFKQRQAKILRTMRDKMKKFRESLGRGPGPGFSIALLEKDVLFLASLAQEFYQEGTEVERMRESLLRLEERVKQVAVNESGLKKNLLEAVLDEINSLRTSLEISPDRKAHMEKILQALSEVGIFQ